MIKGLKLLLAICCVFLGNQSTNAQLTASENFVIKHWGMEEGLPQSSVNDIIQTPDGYLWLATYGGLVRFDGHSFRTFDRSNTPCLITDRILKLVADSEGGIWIFPEYTNTAVIRYKEDQCFLYPIEERLSSVTEIIEDKEGRFWFIGFNQFYLFDGDSFELKEVISDKKSREEALAKEGAWIGSGSNLYKTLGESIVLIKENMEGIGSGIISITESPEEDNKILAGTSTDGILTINVEGEPFVESVSELPFGFFLKFRIDNDHTVYALTAEGIAVRKDNSFESFHHLEEVTDAQLKTIIQDKSGNYWVGTEGDGLYRLKKSFIEMIDEDSGLDVIRMLSLTTLKDGTKLLSTNCNGIYEWDGYRAVKSKLHKYLENGCYWSVFQDSKDNIWVGAGTVYVTENIDKPGKYFTPEDGFSTYGVYSIWESSDGKIWIGTGQGLNVYDGETLTTYTVKDGLYFNDVREFYEDNNGTIWLATKGGLNSYRDGVITKHPLLAAQELEGRSQPEVRDIYKDRNGYMWLGTYGAGLFRLNGDEIIQFTTKDGMFDNVVSHVVEDEFGYFWMGSNRGIARVSTSQLNDYADGLIDQFTVFTYGVNDGMNSAETNGGFHPNVIQEDGKIYFPTVEGVAIVDTRKAEGSFNTPPIYIENIQTGDSVYQGLSKIELPYNESFLQIDYTAVELSHPDKVNFRYKMEGYRNEWIEVGNQRRAIFTKIPPGDYTFKVSVSNSDGNWRTENIDSLRVSVIPPFWQTGWFYALLTLLFVAAAPSFYYVRTRELKKENERQKRFSEDLIKSQEAERRRIASELHDSLGQQILVIKNRAELAKIGQQDKPQLLEQLEEIVASATSSIQSVRSISHNLRPVHLEKFGLTEAIESLCMEMQGTTKIEWTYDLQNIDGIVPKEKEINFYRVIQEALNNILKHSEATEASIVISMLPEKVVVSIADNGRGFNTEKLTELRSLGFLGMFERMENLGGTLHVNSFPEKGTILTLTIPISK